MTVESPSASHSGFRYLGKAGVWPDHRHEFEFCGEIKSFLDRLLLTSEELSLCLPHCLTLQPLVRYKLLTSTYDHDRVREVRCKTGAVPATVSGKSLAGIATCRTMRLGRSEAAPRAGLSGPTSQETYLP